MIKKLLLLSIFTIAFQFVADGQTTIDVTGAGTYTVPVGVTSLNIQAWGGGGSGGGGSTNGVIGGGGGGAGGTYVSSVISVTAGQNISYYVGAGAGGINTTGQAGEATWFNTAGILNAQGGAGGSAVNGGTANGGTGSIASSIGTIRTPGNSGANGTTTASGAGGDGANAGGAGGPGRNTRGNGFGGVQPGGGGGGAFKNNNSGVNGGAGGAGRLIITEMSGPPNDEPCSATVAPVNADLLCGSTVSGTVNSATNSGINGCPSLGNPNDDVWYSFLATSTSHNISMNVTSGSTDLDHAVYSGACGALTLVPGSCSGPNSSTVTGLTPGNTYYLQIFSWTTAAQTTTFTLCIGTQPPCPTPVRSTGPITFATITDVSINASFPASVPSSDNYIVIRSLTATAPVLTNGTTYTVGQTLPGGFTVVDTDNNTNFTATGLTQTTTYYFFIFSMNNVACTGGPVYSTNSLNGSASTVMPSYCIPSSTQTGYYIDNFNTSGGVTNIAHINSGFSPGGYGDFTSRNVTQYPGQAINFVINYVPGTFASRVWVDWNNDLDFVDAGEQVFILGYANPTNGSFTVPPTAVPGTYRMRVRADWTNTTTLSPCGFDDQSETHDYTLIVTPLNCTANPIALTAVTTSATTATISWTAPSPAPANGYEYIVSTDNSTGTPAGDITGTTNATSVNLTGLLAGTTYYVFVRGLCTPPDKGVWIPTTFTTACGNIVNTPTLCPIIVDVQGNNPYTATPYVANPTATLGCGNVSVNLVANANLRETTSYIVEQIAYPNPVPRYDFPLPAGPGAQVITQDDVWAPSWTNIGFNFCFYNQTYTQALVGANGAITFDQNIIPGSGSGWSITDNIPSLAGSLINYAIYGVYHDMDPRGLTGTPIKSRIVGTAGCREFQVAWNNIPMFGDATRLYTGMVVLHESTNIIEVFIKEKRIENGNVNPWNGGNAIVGIQGNAGLNEALAAPCRNGLDANWETTNEAWRFTPNGAVIAPTSVTWYQGSVAPGNIVTGNPDNSYTALTGNTYIAVSNYSNLCGANVSFTDAIVVNDGRKNWNGSVSTDWATASNWTPSGVPTSVDCITVPVTASTRYPVINGTTNGNGYSLLVLAGASVLMQSNATLTIVDQVNVNAGATFTIENNASLVQVNNVTNTGSITMYRDTNIRRQDYVYWGAPVTNFPLANVIPASPASLRFQWNPSFDRGPSPGGFQLDYGLWEVASGNMVTGKGYIIRGPSSFDTNTAAIYTAAFTGVPNNGTYTVPIRRGTYAANGNYVDQGSPVTKDDDNYNLVGNPYPSALSARAFLTLNTDIDGTVYLWTHGTRIQQGVGSPFYGTYVYNYNISDYLEYNLSGPSVQSGFYGYIGAGQGFFVLMKECASPVSGVCPVATSSVTFNNTMRSSTYRNDQFFRTTEDAEPLNERIWLDLISPTGGTSTTLVAYVQGATNDKDRLYDARTIGGLGKDLYSILNDENYVIQGRQHPLDANDQVPLGITTEESGVFNIAIHGLDGLFESTNQEIYLEDRELNVIHDLRSNPYTFTLFEPGTYNDRFVLRYNNQTLGIGEHQNSGFDIIAVNDQIKVTSGNNPISTVIVYDMLGRVLADYKNVNLLNFDFKLPNQSKGTLIVKATLYNGEQKIKKVIY